MPNVQYTPGRNVAIARIREGSWNAPDGTRHKKGNLGVVVILVPNGFRQDVLRELKTQLQDSFGQAHIDYRDAHFRFRPTLQRADYRGMLMKASPDRKPSFVIFINPWPDRDAYDRFRQAMDINCGVPSICIKQQKLNANFNKKRDNPASRHFSGFVSNNALKINSRFSNGINQAVAFILPLGKLMRNTIILGADVTHPGSSSVGAGSIAALVGTVDRIGLSYGGSARPNFPRQEVCITALPLGTIKLTGCFSGLTISTKCSRSDWTHGNRPAAPDGQKMFSILETVFLTRSTAKFADVK